MKPTPSLRRREGEVNPIAEKEVRNVIADESNVAKTRKEAVYSIPEGGVDYHNFDQNIDMKVSRHTAKHIILHNTYYERTAVANIGAIVNNAVKIGELPVKGDERYTNSVSIYYTPINIDGKQFSSRLVVKELINYGKVVDTLSLYDATIHKERLPYYNLNSPESSELGARYGNHKNFYKVRDLIHNSQAEDKELLGLDKDFEGSFSITAEDAGLSRKSAVEAMGGEERWGEWLDAAAARRLGGSRSAGRREETRARLHRLAAGEGYDPAAMADFRQTLVNNVADGGAATMNVTDADVRLAMFEATKNEKGGVSEIAEDARTERQLREEEAASHDEMEDVLSQELRFSLFGGLHRKQAILDFSYLNYGLNDADIAGLEAVRRAMEETPLADANRHGLLPMIHEF